MNIYHVCRHEDYEGDFVHRYIEAESEDLAIEKYKREENITWYCDIRCTGVCRIPEPAIKSEGDDESEKEILLDTTVDFKFSQETDGDLFASFSIFSLIYSSMNPEESTKLEDALKTTNKGDLFRITIEKL